MLTVLLVLRTLSAPDAKWKASGGEEYQILDCGSLTEKDHSWGKEISRLEFYVFMYLYIYPHFSSPPPSYFSSLYLRG